MTRSRQITQVLDAVKVGLRQRAALFRAGGFSEDKEDDNVN